MIAGNIAEDVASSVPGAVPVVYVPALLRGEQMVGFLCDPDSLSFADENGNAHVPVYGNLLSALQGRNADNLPHQGFVLIGRDQILGTYVDDLVNREKVSKLPPDFKRTYLRELCVLSQVCKPI